MDMTCGVVTADLEPSGRPSLSPERSCAGSAAPASLAALLRLERSFPSMFLRQVLAPLAGLLIVPGLLLGEEVLLQCTATL